MAASKGVRTVINQRVRALVWTRYTDEHPREGHEYRNWVESTAEELGLPESHVERIVADQASAVELAIRQQNQSVGQTVANMMGASLTEAYAAIMRGLKATERKYFKDRQGRPVLQCPECQAVLTEAKCGNCAVDGEPMYVEIPLYDIQVRAGKEMLKVHGAYAPHQVEITKTTLHAELSDEQLLEHVNQLSRAIQGELAATSQTARGLPHRAANQAVIEGQVLLADGMHGDSRRTGPRKSKQAIPEETVHQEPARVAE